MADIKVPTLGESVSEATVAKWFKKVGDAVAQDEPVVELETDKVTVEVRAESAGTLSEISAPEGTEVKVGALLGSIGAGGAAAPAKKAEAPKAAPAKTEAPKPPRQPHPHLRKPLRRRLPNLLLRRRRCRLIIRWHPRCATWSMSTASTRKKFLHQETAAV